MQIVFFGIRQIILLILKFYFHFLKKNMKKEYKIEIIKEGALGTLLFGSSKLPIKKMTEIMNKYGQEGWDISFQLIEKHRLLLFWSREAVIITFSRNKP